MCGDVMTGRGIDQILPQPNDPLIREPYMKTAEGYVVIAEQINGRIPRPVSYDYIWGDAIAELNRVSPDLKIINLETSVTTSDDFWGGKHIHYRMHPANVDCLTVSNIDFCSLANNHVLDFGYSGLTETLSILQAAGLKTAGAGQILKEAQTAAIIEVAGKGRVIIFSFGTTTSGIQLSWAAREDRPGVNLLRDFSQKTIDDIEHSVRKVKQEGDIVIASIHWGDNWGYDISDEQREFAHKLIDYAEIDVIHGHSSHHIRPMEVYNGKLILYGCGDFLNDYEGISGYEEFRDDLTLMYFANISPATGNLLELRMTPLQIKRFRLNATSRTDAIWMRDSLNRECRNFNTRLVLDEENSSFTLLWD